MTSNLLTKWAAFAMFALFGSYSLCDAPNGDTSGDSRSPKLEIKVIRRENGEIYQRYTFYRDKTGAEVEHGVSAYYDSRGNKSRLIEYSAGKRHGRFVRWSPVGGTVGLLDVDQPRAGDPQVIEVEGRYKNNREHGVWREWNEDGSRKRVCTYSNGRKTGTERFYQAVFTSGYDRLHVELTYDDEGRLKHAKEYYPSGGVRREGNYAPGSQGPVSKWMYDEDGVRHGTWRFFDLTEKCIAEGEWRDGVPWQGVCGASNLVDRPGSNPVALKEIFGEYREGKLVREIPKLDGLDEEKWNYRGPRRFPEHLK